MADRAFRKRSPLRNGALALIAMLMIVSAAIRVAFDAGPALAKEFTPEQVEDDRVDNNQKTSMEADLQQLLVKLQQRERMLIEQEERLADRERALEIAGDAIDAKLEELQAAEAALGATLSLAETASEGDLTRLTEVYEKMKPKEAAAMFEEMEPMFAAGFLARMNPDAAAGIMAGLTPKVAYTLSVVLAGRNATVPTK